tara:strand:- start:252 stop:1214 length:963 start_codon:yes stop_codon:yes gene_type:complete
MAENSKSSKERRFFISREDWKKVIAYAESSYHQFKAEIGGQMVVVEDEDGDFIIKDPVILKQSVSGGNCEMEEEALAVHYSKMVGKYGDKVRHCWWHSHHTMGAFWSGTDDSTIMDNPTNDFSVSLVVNLKQEYKLRVQFFYPIEHEENITLHFLEDEIDRNEEIDTEVKNLCSKMTIAKPNVINSQYATGYQGALWADTDKNKQETSNYNSGYGINDDVYSNYRTDGLDLDSDGLDISLIPEDKKEAIMDLVEEAQDKIIQENCTYEEWLEIRKAVNKSIERYNLRMKKISRGEISTLMYHYWPSEFLENIKTKENNAD